MKRPRVRWWAPNRTCWWVAALFILGSAAFAIGAVPAYVDWVGARVAGVRFVVGSIFLTAAAGAAGAAVHGGGGHGPTRGIRH